MINFSLAMTHTSAFNRDAAKAPLDRVSRHLETGAGRGTANREVGVCLARAAAQQQTGQRERGYGEKRLGLR
jgi:hypothetical protein